MERDFFNDDFELFLKQKADQHKLYPSDKAWKGIYNSLHPGMRWFKIGSGLLVLSALIFIYQETSLFNSSSPASKISTQNVSSSTAAVQATGSGSYFPLKSSSIPLVARKAINNTTSNNKKGSSAAFSTLPAIQESLPAKSNTVAYQEASAAHELNGFILRNDQVLPQNSAINVTIPRKTTVNNIDNTTYVPDDALHVAVVNTDRLLEEENISMGDFNWSQELAAIKLIPQKKSRFNLQFYFSPTVGYRKLADNQNNYHGSSLSLSSNSGVSNVNKYVDHKPAIGAELGSNILFSATRNLVLKSGLQFNYSRYNIAAYKFYSEKASIALNTAGPVADTISSYTSIRNLGGYAPEQLQNQYLQISVPVGAEVKLLGNKRLQLNVAGTIQPTFLLFSDTYLLSTNYLNYTKEPSLIRKWNVHSSFETFLSYKTGGFRWQVGPQFRYQLMSSFNDRYPIKEYLFEYGLKIGVSKTLR